MEGADLRMKKWRLMTSAKPFGGCFSCCRMAQCSVFSLYTAAPSSPFPCLRDACTYAFKGCTTEQQFPLPCDCATKVGVLELAEGPALLLPLHSLLPLQASHWAGKHTHIQRAHAYFAVLLCHRGCCPALYCSQASTHSHHAKARPGGKAP